MPFFLGVHRITRPVSVVIRQGDDAILDESEKFLVYSVVCVGRLISNCEHANSVALVGSTNDFVRFGILGQYQRDLRSSAIGTRACLYLK